MKLNEEMNIMHFLNWEIPAAKQWLNRFFLTYNLNVVRDLIFDTLVSNQTKMSF